MSSETGSAPRRLNLKDVKEAPSAEGETVGLELRAIRLQRGETIGQISEVLRIRKELVEAIEHGRADLLPGQAYAVGFVRAYSDYLRLDTADVVRRYKAELAAQQTGGGFTMPVPEDEQRFSFTSVLIILICIGAAGFGAWYLAARSGLFGDRPLGPTQVAEEPVTGGTTPQPEIVEPSTPPVTAPAPQPAPAPAPPPPPPEPVAVAPPPRPGGIVAPAPGEAVTPATGREMGKSNADARIVFVARRPVLLTIRSTELRNTLYVNRTLEVGDSYRVPNKSGLAMDAADAGALDVVLDQEFIGRAGADGAVIKDFALSPEAYGAPAAAPATPEPATPETPPADTPPAATEPPVPAPAPTPAPAVPPASPPVTPPTTPDG